jgi:hypothetical protein
VARPSARQVSFADLELLRQGVRLEPLLQAICDLLGGFPTAFKLTWKRDGKRKVPPILFA